MENGTYTIIMDSISNTYNNEITTKIQKIVSLDRKKWFTYMLALLTGGEAFHDHHHDEPVSILHLPKRGFWNRIFDYNGTFFLVMEKLKWAKDLNIAPRFATVKAKA